MPDLCFLNRYLRDHPGPHYFIVSFKNICKKTCRIFQPKFAKRWKVFPLYSIWSVQYSTFRTNFLQYLLHNISFFKSQKNQMFGPKVNQISVKSSAPKLHSLALPLAASSPPSKWFKKWGHTSIHMPAPSSLPYSWRQEQIKIYILYIYDTYLYLYIIIMVINRNKEGTG